METVATFSEALDFNQVFSRFETKLFVFLYSTFLFLFFLSKKGNFTLKPAFQKAFELYWPFYRFEDRQKAIERFSEIKEQEAKKQGQEPLSFQ